MRALLAACLLTVACGPSPALEPALPPVPVPYPAARAEAPPAATEATAPTAPGRCAGCAEPEPGAEARDQETFSLGVSLGDADERVEISLDRKRDVCAIEARSGGSPRKATEKAAQCVELFQKLHTLDGAWGSGGLGCEGCASFRVRHGWSSGRGGALSESQRGARAAFFPRAVAARDQATGLYAEAGRLGRLTGQPLSLLP